MDDRKLFIRCGTVTRLKRMRLVMCDTVETVQSAIALANATGLVGQLVYTLYEGYIVAITCKK